jgi:DNA invertase Pin-like site-specific DNA recombinase
MTSKTTTLKLTACVRVSRRNGRSGESFMSPTEQRDRIEADARARGAVIVAWHDETDSVSGKTTKRAGLQAAVADIENGKADGLIVAKLDRFSRNAVEGMLLLRQLKEKGARFIAVQEGIDLGAKSSPNGKLILGIMLQLAEWQLDSLTLGWESTRERHIARGVGTQEPYGYRKGGDHVLKPERDEAPWVALAFELRAEGMSWQAIADTLYIKGAKPRTVARFTHARIKAMVENRAYLGEVRSGDYVNAKAHEPIVSVELWERANGQRKTAAKAEKTPSLLAGIVRCASCGQRMRITQRGRDARGNVIKSYRCRAKHSFGVCPKPAFAMASELERIVLDEFRASFIEVLAMSVPDAEVIDGATTELEACERDVREYLTDPAVTALKRIDEGAWRSGLEARNGALEAAQAALTEVRNRVRGVELPDDIALTLDELPSEEVRGYLSAAFETVVVGPTERSARVALADRVALWSRDEPSAPSFDTGGLCPVERPTAALAA